jgi:hypothetical protein
VVTGTAKVPRTGQFSCWLARSAGLIEYAVAEFGLRVIFSEHLACEPRGGDLGADQPLGIPMD